jgi:hypothetical protein
MDGPRAVDRGKGQTDAKVGPREKDQGILWLRSRIAQLDADICRTTGDDGIGMYGYLLLGVGRAGGAVEQDRRAKHLAKTAHVLGADIGFHVNDGLPASRQVGGRRDGQHDRSQLAKPHVD